MSPTAHPTWLDPEPEMISEGLYRIALPIPITSCPAVNVYLLEDDSGPTLVDGGWAMERAHDALRVALGTLGYSLHDVRTLIVTHAHRDHYPLAASIRRRYGAAVRVGRGEAANLASLRSIGQTSAFGPELHERLLRSGASDLAAKMWDGFEGAPDPDAWADPDAWLSDGDVIATSRLTLTVLETPGHTSGHVAFTGGDHRILFSGDHILTDQVPTVGYERHPVPSPLTIYLASLARVRALPDVRVLPGHGPVGASSHARVDELAAHFEEFLEDVLRRVKGGTATAWEIAQAIAADEGQPLDELDPTLATQRVLIAGAALQLLSEQELLTLTADQLAGTTLVAGPRE